MAPESKFRSQENDELFRAILSLEDLGEAYAFFEDLLTIKELQDISQRWQVARLLSEGKTYAEIAGLTKASAATISRVNKCIEYGAGGYTLVLERLKQEE
ncbi:MAG: TrpR-like protein YerC/YecD [Firmicutes bacterium]|nr:TrpR-like protein YerC/YecD [Bacillota bacterium]